jgi:hypothetical protein
MGLGLNLGLGGFLNNVTDRITIGGGNIDKSLDNFKDGYQNTADEYFNLSSPDGVQSEIEAMNAASNSSNTTLSAYANFTTPDASASTTQSVSDNESQDASNNGTLLYQQDVQSAEYEVGEGSDAKKVSVGLRPYSVFNKYSLVNFRGTPLSNEGLPGTTKSNKYNTVDQLSLDNPTASKIIEKTSVTSNKGYRYDYSDFALTKYYGKIPNNMMITLRRFAFPAPDDIISPKSSDGDDIGQGDIARAITWMGGPTGNEIADILKFSHGFNWKDAEAAVQTLNSQQAGRSGEIGQLINGNRFLSAAASAANGENAYDAAVRNANAGFDAFSETYPNHVFGPLNVIKNVLVREQGLTFDNEFTIKFEYELRDLGGANPKILILDQLSNLLALTYNNAPFWGGDVRYIGDGSIAKPLGNIAHIKSGNYGEFLKSVISDFTGGGSGSIMDDLKGIMEGGGKAFSNMIGGSLLKLFNSPQGGQAVNSLLTGDPTGQWHLTVGNPLNPIMVIGNLACTNTEISFEGNIGPYDFPERLVATVTLKPGRPRDKAEIESMFNAGRGRFYLQPNDGVDINNTYDVSAYGNKDERKKAGSSKYNNTFRKIANG